ncbi:hypothetical protein [Leifsonia poae]|uniref:Uncharacterized protein n=1 Tax=Leifsonia poae TaxID=110933 RepID=A0A9W6M1C5_9MICO|nr:hypothetical protein [Leifsonia poae]GLJ77579.1 hypothetical protein GCM10017584_31530 [Leifsonia poae]
MTTVSTFSIVSTVSTAIAVSAAGAIVSTSGATTSAAVFAFGLDVRAPAPRAPDDPADFVRGLRAGVVRVVDPAAAAAVFAGPEAGRRVDVRAGAAGRTPSSSPVSGAIPSPDRSPTGAFFERVARAFDAGLTAAVCAAAAPSLASAPATWSGSGLSEGTRSELTPLTYQALLGLAHPAGNLWKPEPRKVL